MVTIRPATVADSAGLAAVQLLSYRTAYASAFPPAYFAAMTLEEQTADWQAWPVTHPNDLLFVAVADDQVGGYILARAEPEIYPGYAAEVLALHVQPSWQKQGVGRALLRQGCVSLVAHGCATGMLWTLQTNPVRAWYERLGGQYLGEKQYAVDDWLVVEVAYGWPQLSALCERL